MQDRLPRWSARSHHAWGKVTQARRTDSADGGSERDDQRLAPWGRGLLDELLESLPDAVIACDAKGSIVLWSTAARERYGYSAEEALGARAVTLLQTRFPLPLLEIMEEFVDRGSWQGIVVQRDKHGREHTVEARWRARYGDAGELVGGFGIEREPVPAATTAREPEPAVDGDGDDWETVEEELRRAERLDSLAQLASGVAHDFNNALGIIINYAALVAGQIERMRLAPTETEREDLREDLREVQKAGERAVRLAHQLLDFARQEPGTVERLDLNETIGDLEALLRQTLGPHLHLVVAPAPELHPVEADPVQIREVLVNLVANARDATPAGGTVTIDTANVVVDAHAAADHEALEPGPYVRLRVSDTGVGMPPDVRERAFEPFFTTREVGHGTGLGLSSVHGIIARAQGHSELRSSPGHGTTFTAMLPALADPALEMPSAAVDLTTGVDGPAPAILVVEDERAAREVTQRILGNAGYRVIAAPDGVAALELPASAVAEIDVLLTDVIMPEMLGPQLAERLRARKPELRVLYMSGFAGAVLNGATADDAAELIEKPFTAATLLQRVADALAPRVGADP